ncbi:MAG TPA: tRNA 2-thiouridine(34) synthase MnmA [Acidimicrobiales bacterium]|nr:tRNA 2-thiouridine(34) synthase MnmA [Acidimicrobiales bacterium]
MKVLAAMSGGVDSSVAAALLVEDGHDVTGVTLRLWAGAAVEGGCCSEAEIDDARRVAHQLGIDHVAWTFTDEFEAQVVAPYVAAHAAGLTPNPCIECNRHLKFGRLLRRAAALGFDAVATGHHALIELDESDGDGGGGRFSLRRGADRAKDQSYVLYVLGQAELARCLFPVGRLTKDVVRAHATSLGLVTADKPDSQDVCFITTAGGRQEFLSPRIDLHPGRVVGLDGSPIGRVAAVELVTVGQRRGLGTGGGGRRYAISVDPAKATVVAGDLADLDAAQVELIGLTWVRGAPPARGAAVEAQSSAHGRPVAATFDGPTSDGATSDDVATVSFADPRPRVAPGQSVVLYQGNQVLGGGIAT